MISKIQLGGVGIQALIPMLAAPSSSLAFPDFTPEIGEHDDRVRAISEILHRTLSNNMKEKHQPQNGKSIEIEAKIGLVNFFEQANNPVLQAIVQDMKNKPYWQILGAQKMTNVLMYSFAPKISGFTDDKYLQSGVQDEQLFNALRDFLADQATKQPAVFQASHQQTRDDVLIPLKFKSDSLRATYLYNPQTQDYQQSPHEVIIKNRLGDINVRRGQDQSIFKSDFRISISSEANLGEGQLLQPINENYRVEQSRFKDRHKFKFNYLIIDLTKTETLKAQVKEPPSYEVEVEIGDMEYLRQNMADFCLFNKIIRRYLQNVAALMTRLEKFKQDFVLVANPTPSLKTDQKLIEFENNAIKSYVKVYSKKAPRSFVGDYLSSVAYQVDKKDEENNVNK